MLIWLILVFVWCSVFPNKPNVVWIFISSCWNLNAVVTVVRGGTYKRFLGHEVSVLMNGLMTLSRGGFLIKGGVQPPSFSISPWFTRCLWPVYLLHCEDIAFVHHVILKKEGPCRKYHSRHRPWQRFYDGDTKSDCNKNRNWQIELN